jgi:hypothetical protein
LAQCTAFCVGDGDDMFSCLGFTFGFFELLFEQAESDGGLGGSA